MKTKLYKFQKKGFLTFGGERSWEGSDLKEALIKASHKVNQFKGNQIDAVAIAVLGLTFV